MEKRIYEEKPLAIEEVVSAGVRTTITRFAIEETENGWECEESCFNHKEPLTEDDYGRLVSFLVREVYSADEMEALHNNYLLSPDAYKEDMDTMQRWRQIAKQTAEQVIANAVANSSHQA